MDNQPRITDEYNANPEAKPTDHSRKQPNKGEINFVEKYPADPLASDEAMRMSHRGGEVSQRTELY